jgi:hypothetical protein
MTQSHDEGSQSQEPPSAPPPPPPPTTVTFVDPFRYDSIRGSKGQDRQTFEIEHRSE